jgi:carbonic anhydrase
MPIPALIDGWSRFRAGRFREQRDLFARLHREGQRPQFAMIACCDSRVDPAIVFDCDPGDLFVIRNVANLVPPYERAGSYHGTSAAIEFAVAVLGVRHVVVLGHARCGGISALLADALADTADLPFVSAWMGLARPALAAALAAPASDEQARQLLCEQHAIRLSLQNLQSFPWIRERIDCGALQLHGWHFDFRDGALSLLDRRRDRFRPAVPAAEAGGDT